MAASLLTLQEIVTRFRKGGNLFDITIEKWKRIRECLVSLEQDSDVGPIIESSRTGGAFCLEYQEDCLICPIEKWCKDPHGTYQTIVKLMYMYAADGHEGYKEQALRHIEKFLEEMEECKEEFRRRLH